MCYCCRFFFCFVSCSSSKLEQFVVVIECGVFFSFGVVYMCVCVFFVCLSLSSFSLEFYSFGFGSLPFNSIEWILQEWTQIKIKTMRIPFEQPKWRWMKMVCVFQNQSLTVFAQYWERDKAKMQFTFEKKSVRSWLWNLYLVCFQNSLSISFKRALHVADWTRKKGVGERGKREKPSNLVSIVKKNTSHILYIK